MNIEQVNLLDSLVDFVKVDSISDENVLVSSHMQNFLSYLIIIAKFVESKFGDVVKAALDAFRALVKCYSHCDLLNAGKSEEELLKSWGGGGQLGDEIKAELTVVVAMLLKSLTKKSSASKKLIWCLASERASKLFEHSQGAPHGAK